MSDEIHPYQKKRLERIEKVFEFIKETQPTPTRKLSWKFAGTGTRTLREYLKILTQQGKIRSNKFGEFVVNI